MVYESIYEMLSKHVNATEVVLAVDDKNSWRRAYFPRYKETRKDKRDKTGIDFSKVFPVINRFIADLKHHMPFKVIKVWNGEADDVIGTIALDIEYGSNTVSCVIHSNDEDYIQLISDKVKLWNPTKRKYIEFPVDLGTKRTPVLCNNSAEFLAIKILAGQSKDDIFNIKTPTNWGKTPETEGKKKPGFGPTSANKVISEGQNRWLEENNLWDNYKRNKNLIDLSKIPNAIKDRVMDAYWQYSYPPPNNIYEFFKKYKMRGYLEKFDSVERNLLKLYKEI
jgi:5'-3' exonuclease